VVLLSLLTLLLSLMIAAVDYCVPWSQLSLVIAIEALTVAPAFNCVLEDKIRVLALSLFYFSLLKTRIVIMHAVGKGFCF
jgi:heme O synthase-like polyprenyltransferase